MSQVKSQPLRWHGGKSDLAHWIHSLAPPSVIADKRSGYTHRNVVFAGGLGEFWNWLPFDGVSETVNDLNNELMNFWAVLRCPTWFGEFQRRVDGLPFTDAFLKTGPDNYLQIGKSCIDLATDFFIKFRMSRQGLGKCYATPTTRTRRGMNENVSAWLSAVDGLPDCHARLRRVELRQMDGVEFIAAYDHKRSLFYCDPPYKPETRVVKDAYGKYELTDDGHRKLLDRLASLEGKFMLSGYHSELYDRYAAENEWFVSEREAPLNSSAKKSKERKIEVLWTNYQPPEFKK